MFGRSGWKIAKRSHAGGIYLFEDRAAAERYREKHEQRLSAMGLTGVAVNTFSVNTELSVLTMAGASLGQARCFEKRFDIGSRCIVLTTFPCRREELRSPSCD